jgi:hypothetical protein
MVSYDESFAEVSDFNFDDYFLNQLEDENPPTALVEQQIVEAEMKVEDQAEAESEMDLDVDTGNHGVAPNQM